MDTDSEGRRQALDTAAIRRVVMMFNFHVFSVHRCNCPDVSMRRHTSGAGDDAGNVYGPSAVCQMEKASRWTMWTEWTTWLVLPSNINRYLLLSDAILEH